MSESGSEQSGPSEGPDPWCTWCHFEPPDGELPYRIKGEDGGRWPPAFCSLQCASRWGNAAHQDRIYHVEHGRGIHTDGGTERCERCGDAEASAKISLGANYDGSMKSDFEVCNDCVGALGEWFSGETSDREPEPGMKPHELFQRGSDKNVCRECGDEFQTWRGAWDHQHDQHDGYQGVGIDFSETEDWIEDTETFDWWVSQGHGEEADRVELELWEAAELEDKGLTVHLAEPIRGVRRDV